MKKVIYIAGPFRGPSHWDIAQNIRRAEALALQVWRLGHVALCPHANTGHFQDAAPDEVWLQGDLELLRRCDAVLLTPDWLRSAGARAEFRFAESLGILDADTMLAHQVNCGPRDIEILARTGTRIVHNPLANTILGSGMPPVIEMLERGIPVAISTDGSGSADNQNILAAARLASQYQKAFHQDAELLPAQEVLEMITADAADVLGLETGRLEEGFAADITVVGLSRPNLTPTRISNVVENLIWASDGSEVSHVIAGGKLLREGNRYLTLDVDEILDRVQRLSEHFDRYREEVAPELSGTGAHQ